MDPKDDPTSDQYDPEEEIEPSEEEELEPEEEKRLTVIETKVEGDREMEKSRSSNPKEDETSEDIEPSEEEDDLEEEEFVRMCKRILTELEPKEEEEKRLTVIEAKVEGDREMDKSRSSNPKEDESSEEEDPEEEIEPSEREEGEEDPEEPKKLSKESKEKSRKMSLSPKEPATSIDRPTRERKPVQRHSAVSFENTSKGIAVKKGQATAATQLKDIPNVALKLSKRKPDEKPQDIHSLLLGKRAKTHNLKKNINLFSGSDSEKQSSAVEKKQNQFSKADKKVEDEAESANLKCESDGDSEEEIVLKEDSGYRDEKKEKEKVPEEEKVKEHTESEKVSNEKNIKGSQVKSRVQKIRFIMSSNPVKENTGEKPIKDQGKCEVKKQPSRDELLPVVRKFLKHLGTQSGVDLKHRKKEVMGIFEEVLDNIKNNLGDEDNEDDLEEPQEDSGPKDSPLKLTGSSASKEGMNENISQKKGKALIQYKRVPRENPVKHQHQGEGELEKQPSRDEMLPFLHQYLGKLRSEPTFNIANVIKELEHHFGMNLEDRTVEVVCIISEMLKESENKDEEPKEDTEKAKDGVAEPEEDIDRPKDSPSKPQGSASQKDGMDEKRSHLSGNASFPCTRVKKRAVKPRATSIKHQHQEWCYFCYDPPVHSMEYLREALHEIFLTGRYVLSDALERRSFSGLSFCRPYPGRESPVSLLQDDFAVILTRLAILFLFDKIANDENRRSGDIIREAVNMVDTELSICPIFAAELIISYYERLLISFFCSLIAIFFVVIVLWEWPFLCSP